MLKAPYLLFRASKQTGSVFIFCQFSKVEFHDRHQKLKKKSVHKTITITITITITTTTITMTMTMTMTMSMTMSMTMTMTMIMTTKITITITITDVTFKGENVWMRE